VLPLRANGESRPRRRALRQERRPTEPARERERRAPRTAVGRRDRLREQRDVATHGFPIPAEPLERGGLDGVKAFPAVS